MPDRDPTVIIFFKIITRYLQQEKILNLRGSLWRVAG
jgi:hypothetical protein